ncbi:MAG: anhydro-N-acetylmuramic acid kinase [Chlorobiota bacterium]
MTKDSEIFIGVMTGTSMDGIDIAAAKFNTDNIEILSMGEYSFSPELQQYLLNLKDKTTLQEISQLNVRFADEVANAINLFLKENGINKEDVNSIGFHGQTVWHQPDSIEFVGQKTASTYQIGSAAQLAIKTGINVVSNFREADIALEGQGAPLVPIFDYSYLKLESEDTIVLNIGGIANITYLPKGAGKSDVIAFDTGPGNCLIDMIAAKSFGKSYDAGGEIAKSGKLDESLLSKLMNEDYISAKYPKSTGKELFNNDFIDRYNTHELKDEDLLCTLTHFTAKSIAQNIGQVTNNNYRLLVAGGGAKNNFLIELIESYSNQKTERIVLDGKDITGSREALLMAQLAYLRVNELPGNIPSVTGARREVVLGSATLS